MFSNRLNLSKLQLSEASSFFKLLCLYMLIFRHPNIHEFGQLFDYDRWAPVGIFKIFSSPIDKSFFKYIAYSYFLVSFAVLYGKYLNLFSKLFFVLACICLDLRNNFGAVFHGHHLFVMALGILSITQLQSDQKSVLGRFYLLRPNAGIALLKCYIVYVWFILGLQKVFYSGPDWVTSSSFANIVFMVPGTQPFSEWLFNHLPQAYSLLAGGALLLELLSPLALVFKRFAYVLPCGWMAFHLLVTALMGGHYSFWTSIPVYMIFWIHPEPLFTLKSLPKEALKSSEQNSN